MRKLTQWYVMQDVHDLGETLEIYKEGFRFDDFNHLISEFEAIPRLGALQILFSEHPYYGRELRYFNQAPWWYYCRFDGENLKNSVAMLRFLSVDYYCKVYLNGILIGEHEGYFEEFEFDITDVVKEKDNQLFVKVWSPWDTQILKGAEAMRGYSVKRVMAKGTYEHADGFIQRDVNPIGILGDVELRISHYAAFMRDWNADVSCEDGGSKAKVCLSAQVNGELEDGNICAQIIDSMGNIVAEQDTAMTADGKIQMNMILGNPNLWNCWDRGEAYLYLVRLVLTEKGERVDCVEKKVGVRSVKLERTEKRTRFYLNGSSIYLRGTSYFPDVYLSEMLYDRYYRDLEMIKKAGFNAVRVHVHVEKDEFYTICDELGLMVIQDSDFNWDHPTDEGWMDRATAVFGAMVRARKNHPSIICWVALNEPDLWKMFTNGLLEQTPEDEIMLETLCVKLTDELKKLDSERPYIRASREEDDLESGDSHNYTGSLAVGTAYTDIYGTTEKLNTEFGMDVPGNQVSLFKDRRIFESQKSYFSYHGGLQEYQYRLLCYYADHYRLQKYSPCSGYFQFMFIDLCPQSFYGAIDFYGIPKKGYYALLESCQPLGLIAEQSKNGFCIYLANDYLRKFSGNVYYSVIKDETCCSSGHFEAEVGEDCLVCAGEVFWEFDGKEAVELRLEYRSKEGEILAKRIYQDAFREFPCMAGVTFNNELGMRTYLFQDIVKERLEQC